MHNKSSFIQ